MRTLSRQIVLGAGLAVFFSCTRDVDAPVVAITTPTHPAHEILDGAHHSGNPHFFFLPPIAPNPTPAGTFDPTQSPTVTICLVAGAACGPTVVAQFSMTSGTGSEVVRVDPASQTYVVNWHTDRCLTGPCTLDPTQVYRIRVLVVNTELGHADVEVVPTKQQAKSLMTGDSVVLVNGTLPVKFRIEQGAVFAVGPSVQVQTVQTPVTPSGSSTQLTLPPGSITQPVGIVALPDTAPTGTNTGALVDGSVYDLGPSGTVFATPIQVSVRYSPGQLPAGVTESRLRLFTYSGGRWVEVPGSTVNLGTHVVTGSTGHFSEYAVFGSLEVSANGAVTCASTSGSIGLCWGQNSFGQLATGDFGLRPVPTPISGGHPFSLVVTGQLHACGLSGGFAYCWGINTAGEIGTGSLSDPATAPAAVQGGQQFWSLAVTDGSSCGLSQDSMAYCWGDNSSDQLGASGPAFSATPVAVTGGLHFRFLGAGETHVCGIASDGQTYCWGANGFDQLGDPAAGPARATPSPVVGAPAFVSIAVGANHTCGLDTNGNAWCWGWNSAGQLGNGDDSRNPSAMSATPIEVITTSHGDSAKFTSLAAGGRHTCGVAVGGGTYCWGRNSFGELGDGSNTWHSRPGPVSGNLPLSVLTAGFRHTCGITLDGVTYCWGANESGQLGTGDLDASTVPSPVVNPALGAQPVCGPSTIINANRFTFALQAGLFPNLDGAHGQGFFDGTQVLFAGGPLFGTDSNHLVLGYDARGVIPTDITPTNVCVISGPSSQYGFAQLSTANGPAGLVATQESFAFSGAADAGYVLMRYTFHNTGAVTIQNFAAGMVMDWDLFFSNGQVAGNLVHFDPGLGVGEVSANGDSHIVGIVPIAASGVVSYRGWGQFPLPAGGGDPKSKAGYFNWLTGGINDSTPPAGDVRELMGVNSLSIAPGDSVVVYFALAGGSDLSDFTNSVAAARRMASALTGTLPSGSAEPQSRQDYFALLSGGIVTGAPVVGDIREEMGLGPNTIQPGDSLVTYFALVGGEDSTAFAANVQSARSMAVSLGQTAPPATTACGATATMNGNRFDIFLGPGTMATAAGGPGGLFDGTQVTFAAGLVYGTDGAHLALGDDVRGAFPTDFTGGQVCTGSTGTEEYSIDTLSLRATTVAPAGLVVTQESFAFSNTPDNGYVLMRYVFRNVGGTPVNGLYAGLVVDWDLLFSGTPADDLIRFDAALGVGEARESNSAVDHHMVGIVPVGPGSLSYRGWHP